MGKIIDVSKGLLPFKVLIILLTVVIIGIIALIIFMSRVGYLELIGARIGFLLTVNVP